MKKWSVKAIRTNLNETQEEFAEHVGIRIDSYRNKEAGRTEFTWEEIKAISNYAKLSPDKIA